MQGTVDGFSYGMATPVAAYLLACLGGALGLRCARRSIRDSGRSRVVWLALGSAAVGTGVWTMHFVAMTGFSVAETPVSHDAPTAFASLAVAVVMTGIGVFIVGYRGAAPMALVTGGTLTGLGMASTHYLGMAGLRLQGAVEYDTPLVAASVLIAVVAATAAVWTAVSTRGLLTGIAASLGMGVAVSGMHYVGMAAVTVRLDSVTVPPDAADSPAARLAPLLAGPVLFLLLAAVVVLFDPRLVAGEVRGPEESPLPGIPAQRTGRPARRQAAWALETARQDLPRRPGGG
ncbi:MHYT domain-containing protein [Streptomyces sp. C10-9-1]|uniref:MHYT domain-containing protein n=1 Tax=Streptomyces sp. C10-9-1 TaxID=1859285 RepID=UPI003D71A6D2